MNNKPKFFNFVDNYNFSIYLLFIDTHELSKKCCWLLLSVYLTGKDRNSYKKQKSLSLKTVIIEFKYIVSVIQAFKI